MAASLDEKIAEAVRRFPVLYDKSCKDFKDNNTKKNAWEDVAKIAGLSSGMLYYRSEKLYPNFANVLSCVNSFKRFLSFTRCFPGSFPVWSCFNSLEITCN